LGADHEEGLAKQLYRSLFAILHSLPDFVEIYPGHGGGSLCGKGIGLKPSSTLGYEKRCNPWLMPQDYRKWHESLQMNASPIPDYFHRMKQLNVNGRASTVEQKRPLMLNVEQVKHLLGNEYLVDFRRPDDYAAGNIKGSVNIPAGPSLPLWAGSILLPDRDLILVVDNYESIFPIIRAMNLVGIDRVYGIIDLSFWSWEEKSLLLKSSPALSVADLHAKKDEYYILDVRNDQEWDAGHIEGANHVELTKIPAQLDEIPLDRPIAVLCRSGNRASIVASMLEKERGAKVYNVRGGMQAWGQSKFPVNQLCCNSI